MPTGPALLRDLAAVLHDDRHQSQLALARDLLARQEPDADRAALRLIALWLMSHPCAADALRGSAGLAGG